MPRNYIDLDQAVTEWAWRRYDEHATRKEKKLREKDLRKPRNYIGLKIDWANVKFVDVTSWSRLAEDSSEDVVSGNGTVPNQTAAVPDNKLYHGKPEAAPYTASVLFQTKFTNNTDTDQDYTMRTEKTTKSSLSTCVESGYTKGFDMSVSLKTPCEVFEANAGYHREFTLTNTTGETFEEELNWGVESSIRVKSKHVAEAMLVVTEKKQAGSFIVNSTVRGYVDVTFTSVKDNNSLLFTASEDIGVIVKAYLEREGRKGAQLDFVKVEGDESTEFVVRITTSGTCKFRYGIRQEARVDQKPINSLNA